MTLANKFAINVSTLRSKASREGWNEILGRSRKQVAMAKQVSSDAVRDVWTERREAIRENIHTIGSRMTAYASQLPEDQLINKADKIKIATEIASKIVGLDKQEDKNVVNIALLGSYSDPASMAKDIQCDTIEGSYSVGHTDSEPL